MRRLEDAKAELMEPQERREYTPSDGGDVNLERDGVRLEMASTSRAEAMLGATRTRTAQFLKYRDTARASRRPFG